MVEVRASAPIRPSEDPQRVRKAVATIVPEGRVEVEDDRVVVTADGLDGFRKLVWKQRILDATRRILLGGLDETGEHATFTLSKQAAYAGLVSFAVGEAPLGDIRIEVDGKDLESLFKEIAPPTLMGKPVSEEQYEKHLERQRARKAAGKYVAREAEPVEKARDEEEE